MFKKRYYVITMLLSLLLILGACGSSDNGDSGSGDSGDETVNIEMWGYSDYDDMVDDIESEFENVNFTYNKLPSGEEYKTKLQTTLIGGGSGPDIVQMDDWVAEFFPYKESFANLYDLGAGEVEDQFLDWKWQYGVDPDGDYMIGYPIDIAPIALYYRQDLFEEAGLPATPEEVEGEIETLDDLIDMAVTLKEKTGARLDTASENFGKAITQMDKGWFDEDGNFIGDQDHVKEAWDYAVKTVEHDVAFNDTSSVSRNVAFGNGDIGALIHASWFKGDLIDNIKGEEGVWRVSFPPGGGGNRGGSFLGVTKESDNAELAFEIVKFMTNADHQLDAFEQKGHIPSMPELYDYDELQVEDEYFGGQNVGEYFMKSAEAISPIVNNPNDSVAADAFEEELDLVNTQGKNPEQAWEDALETIERRLAR